MTIVTLKCYLLRQIWAELLQQLMFHALVQHTANRVLLHTVQLLCDHNLRDIHILKWLFIYNFRPNSLVKPKQNILQSVNLSKLLLFIVF